MKWYLVRLVYHIKINHVLSSTQFDEQWRLIQADSDRAALDHARELGKNGECIFKNVHANDVHWRFIDVPFIQLLTELSHGTEIYSDTVIEDNPEDYINFIRLRAANLLSACRH